MRTEKIKSKVCKKGLNREQCLKKLKDLLELTKDALKEEIIYSPICTSHYHYLEGKIAGIKIAIKIIKGDFYE